MSEGGFDVAKSKEWYLQIKYGLFRDFRIVRMADAQGNKRDGIFIPFVQNGIRWRGVGDKFPVQFLHPRFLPGTDGRLLGLYPFVSEEFRKKMINEGVISPDDKYPCDTIGFLYRKSNKS